MTIWSWERRLFGHFYMHMGDGGTWYGVLRDAAVAFEYSDGCCLSYSKASITGHISFYNYDPGWGDTLGEGPILKCFGMFFVNGA
ncbi:hypothetical protein OROMI_018220 [Orobanche minor]